MLTFAVNKYIAGVNFFFDEILQHFIVVVQTFQMKNQGFIFQSLQNVPDGHLLGQNQPSLGCGFVDGSDQYHKIPGLDQVPNQSGLRAFFQSQAGNGFFQLMDANSLFGTYIQGVPLGFRNGFQQISLVVGDDVVDLTNAVSSSGIFILDAMSADGQLMAKVNVERITTKSIEGTFYNDGKFDHTDFYPMDTWVKVWNASTKDYDEYAVQKGTMTVKQEGDIVTAVASFICDNAVQYDLTFITQYTREHLAFDSEEGEVDYTYAPESYYEFTTDYVESHNQLYFDILAADNSNVTAMVFFVDHVDSDITVPEGVYTINSSMELGTVYASPGVAVGGGPIQSYFCYTIEKEDGIHYDQEGLYCLVDGTVTVKKVNGKLSIDVDAYNSYDLSVKLHFNAAQTAVEDITIDNTNISKRLINGQLFIIRNGETYNANGALVK